MDVGLMFEFLGQMFEPFQPHEFSQKPLLEPLFAAQKAVPGPVDVGDHLALGGHVGGPVGQPQFGLQGVEVRFQLGFLLNPENLSKFYFNLIILNSNLSKV